MVSSSLTWISALAPEDRARLTALSHETGFSAGPRLFNERHRADRFWIVRTGSVALDLHVPGRRAAPIESLGPGDLIGLSWLYQPHTWQLGAEAATPVRAWEFDAPAIRAEMDADPRFGAAVGHWVGQVMAHRMHTARVRLLDLYGPYGSGTTARTRF
ncbi:Crp/Fnr family transcriptional regulator [Streptomyces sp. 4.24]|uniref:Crp/Fnr family transcriptional regulator n=1 Tax=Streptomyces tritrimontium TaxID=3406573 RepID=UPI003BB7D948